MKYFEPIFDTTMDLELAINYLKQNKEIYPIGWESDGTFDVNVHKIKIFYSKYVKEKETKHDIKRQHDFFKLADLLDRDGDLFCQLEYLLRDIPMDDVKKFDLQLIKQNLIYHSMYCDEATAFSNTIVMTDKTQLANLGCIVYSEYPVTVIASTKTAIICSLFVKLCKEAGLQDLINLCIVSNIEDVVKEYTFNVDTDSGCIGVVTAMADIDSAVDAFLFASDQRQWRVQTIFVQENVVNRFKKILDWKTTSEHDIDPEIRKASSNAYKCDNKLFVYEYVGDSNKITNATIIEAYRTVKELIALLKNKKSICVSIWSNDVAESNEIAHSVASNIVWINGYGHIDNPQTANAFYSIINLRYNRIYNDKLLMSDSIESIMKTTNAWIKLDKRARYEIVTNWLRKLKANNSNNVYNNRLVMDDSDSSVSVGQQMCISMKKPVDFIVMNLHDLTSNLLTNPRLLKFLVDGGVIVFVYSTLENDMKEKWLKNTFVDCIDKAILIKTSSVNIGYNYKKNILYTTKVIWSSIGTVFAN